MVGDEALKHRTMLEISYPIENGIINDWDDMCKVWDYAFGSKNMNVDGKYTKILLSEPAMNPLSNRQKMAEVIIIIIMNVQSLLRLEI